MTRYFFNVHLEEHTLQDHEGQDFPDADAAWEAAQSAARDLMATAIVQPGSWHNCYFEVTNEQGEVVLEFPFLEAVDLPRQAN